jgi:hypothetical protein
MIDISLQNSFLDFLLQRLRSLKFYSFFYLRHRESTILEFSTQDSRLSLFMSRWQHRQRSHELVLRFQGLKRSYCLLETLLRRLNSLDKWRLPSLLLHVSGLGRSVATLGFRWACHIVILALIVPLHVRWLLLMSTRWLWHLHRLSEAWLMRLEALCKPLFLV